MELKRVLLCVYFALCNLLIVPYGIETYYHTGTFSSVTLLIVPYGIETLKNSR